MTYEEFTKALDDYAKKHGEWIVRILTPEYLREQNNLNSMAILIQSNDRDEYARVFISETAVGKLDFINLATFPAKMLKLIAQYAYTPLGDRYERKRWRIHILKVGVNQYLNKANGTDGDYTLDNEHEGTDFKTIFTQAEVDEMQDNPDFAGINWDEVLEEVPADSD